MFEIECEPGEEPHSLRFPVRVPSKEDALFITEQQYSLSVWHVGDNRVCTYICNMTPEEQFGKLVTAYHESRDRKVRLTQDVKSHSNFPPRIVGAKGDVLSLREILTCLVGSKDLPSHLGIVVQRGEFEEIKST